MFDVAENVKNIRRRIEGACARAGRSAKDVALVAVAKTFAGARIREVVDAGVPDIGENFVQELVRKREELEDERIRWHFVGHLQTNKVKRIVEWIHLIHSVDSFHLGREIEKYAGQMKRNVNVLVEVNTSGETTKYGVKPEKTEALVEELSERPALKVLGLMTIGPFTPETMVRELPDPGSSRPAFRILRELRDNIQQRGLLLSHLSMGMTNDFEVAIEEGSTIVRIGTAIFGERIKRAAAGIDDTLRKELP